ncbi:hypothetical protein [Methanoculleus frigidifontis]|uniref:hypothetical protein n=1 Tax=Methanoculleus frigidifontis TaxID=2584085 RepID=UPI002659102D|nr:hypothetical protein [Methanoculleus sp. FWC-SCC1]
MPGIPGDMRIARILIISGSLVAVTLLYPGRTGFTGRIGIPGSFPARSPSAMPESGDISGDGAAWILCSR